MSQIRMTKTNATFDAKGTQNTGIVKKEHNITGSTQVDTVTLHLSETTQEENAIFEKPQFSMVKQEETYPVTEVRTSYSSLSTEDKTRYRDILFDLNKNARLFVEDDKTKTLRRCAPPEVKEAFDHGQEIYLVTSIGEQEYHGFGMSDSFSHSKTFFTYNSNSSYSKESIDKKEVVYSTSKMSSWEDLDFIDREEKGVPGVPNLPPSGSVALIDYKWESAFSCSSEHYRESLFGLSKEHSLGSGIAASSGGRHATG